MKYFEFLFLLFLSFCLVGCAATHTAISKRNLDVQTKMSETIFLPPIESEQQKNVYVQFKNTSDKRSFDNFESDVCAALEQDGFNVVNTLDEAYYLLQGNLRAVTKASPAAAEKVLMAGYPETAAGAGVGAAMGGALSDSWKGVGYGAAAGGLISGITSTVANAAVKDVTYMGVTDIRISRRVDFVKPKAEKGEEWERHRTRVVSTANKVNLDFSEASMKIRQDLIHSITGLF